MWVGVYKVQLKQHIEEGKKQSIHSILEKRLNNKPSGRRDKGKRRQQKS